ncbi:MAG: two-component regulator propeller domain-containing protein, partial [Candidatus Hodarchaeota archaeon]
MKNILLNNKYLIIFLAFIFYDKSYSQNWIHYSIVDGLSSNGIEAIVEDDHGIIWIGTSNGGLNKFNGRDWISYSRTNGDSIISDRITEILKDRDGNLWIGTKDGFSKIDPDDDLRNPENWNNYNHTDTNGGLVENYITSILEDADGNIWFGTYNKGISIVDPTPSGNEDPLLDLNNWTIVDDNQLSSLQVRALEKDTLGNIWVGTLDEGSRYNSKSKRWEPFSELGAMGSIEDVHSIFADSYGFVWFGRSDEGVARVLSSDPDSLKEFLFARNTDAIGEDSNGKIWFGTVGNGLFVVDPDSDLTTDDRNWFRFPEENGFLGNVTCIINDSEGDVWVGTQAVGIFRYDVSWTTYSQGINFYSNDFSNFKHVVTILEDDSENLWLGTEGDGLVVVNFNSNLLLKKNWTIITKQEKWGLASNFVRTLFKDDEGNVWIGTSPQYDVYTDITHKGLTYANHTNPNEWHIFTMEDNPGLSNNSVNAIAQDQFRYLWFGTDDGLSRVHIDYIYDNSSWTKYDTTNGLVDNNIQSILIDKYNKFLWLGTAKGLNRKNLKSDLDNNWENIKVLQNKTIITIFKDLKGNMWFGTEGDGVFLVDSLLAIDSLMFLNDSSNWTSISSKNCLASNYVSSIIQLGLNEYWFATNAGVSRLQIVEGESLWTTFTTLDGLQNINVEVAYKDRSGDLWFGTDGIGVTRHRIPPKYPDTFIEKKIDVITTENIHYKFYGADFNTSPQMFRYSYQIDGDGWRDFTHNNTIEFFGLEPGRHVFEVRAMDIDGNIDTTAATDVFYKINPELGGKVETYDSLANVIVRLYFAPKELEKVKGATIEPVRNYELVDPSFVIFAYNIKLQDTTRQFYKPVTLEISFLNNQINNLNKLAIDREKKQQNEQSDWIRIGGTVTSVKDTITITTAIKDPGIYAVRNDVTQQIEDTFPKINIQPRIFSPTGGGMGHGDRATISFMLDNDSQVTVKVYNLAGRLKRILKENIP